MGAVIVSCLILFISWAILRFVDLPYQQLVREVGQVDDGSGTVSIITGTSETISLEASLAVYVVAVLSFFGWIFLVIFGGVGLFALPIDMINEFRHRPKPRKSTEMRKTKENMASAIANLINDGE